jgi:hypothetical protein
MSAIKTIQDCEREIKQLRYELDRLRSQNLDMGGRRVINAGLSKDPKDYMTRGEVLALLGNSGGATKLDSGTLQIDMSIGTPFIGEDVSIRPVVYMPANEKGIPVVCGARLRSPVGGSGTFRLRWNHFSVKDNNTVDLFDGKLLELGSGISYVTFTEFFKNRIIASQDYFTLDIISSGASDEEDPDDANRGRGLYTFLSLRVI